MSTPCGAARRAAVRAANTSNPAYHIDAEFRPVIEAARMLMLDVNGCWCGMEDGARMAFGNTNYACVQSRLTALADALRKIEEA